jgi:hypothetical protein
MDLSVHEDASGEVYVKDLANVPVASFEAAMRVVNDGLALRATHETKMNDVSSRSHSVVTLVVTQTDRSTGLETCARLNLVDLAGSERLKKSESQGMRLKEALFINSSLTALGKVVMALDPHNRGGLGHVPYRDDKLTRVLQNSLGGNSYTALVATIHPSEVGAGGGARAGPKRVQCRATVYGPSQKALGRGRMQHIISFFLTRFSSLAPLFKPGVPRGVHLDAAVRKPVPRGPKPAEDHLHRRRNA